jgi:hypothetical protein
MHERACINTDGSLTHDIPAEQVAARAASAKRHGVDEKHLASLLAEVRESVGSRAEPGVAT